MKKRIVFLSAIVAAGFFTVSCSDDDNESNNQQQEQTVELYTSSGTTGSVSVTDLNASTTTVSNFGIVAGDAEGIYYDAEEDQIIQASRTSNRLDVYGNVSGAITNGSTSLSLTGSSTAGDFINPREISVSGSNVFVAQDEILANGLTNKIFVYSKSGTSFTLQRTYNVGFKLWGIHADGNDLYAVVDTTGDIVKFENILSNSNGNITPTKRVTVEGLVRTHGITYSSEDNVMVLTDIGSATSDSDGGIIVISNFNSVFQATPNNGTIALTAQKRIYGPNSNLGNPVDVAYDYATDKIYIAERLNGGGKVLTFAMPIMASADVVPVQSRSEAAVSAVYLSRR